MKYLFLLMSAFFFSDEGHSQLTIGQAVPDILLPGKNDSMVLLSSLRGKVVLVDFWASWCRPCRESMPGVVRLYKKYHDKGFEVYGVSLDKKKADWLKAIRQDKITFTQVNDSAGWDSMVAAKYFVDEIPTTFLLGKDGNLVAVDLDGKDLEMRLIDMLQ